MAKTLGDKAAIQFAQDHNMDLVIINASLVSGPFLISKIPNSVKDSVALITGKIVRINFSLCTSGFKLLSIFEVLKAKSKYFHHIVL